ncbi:hypothetical protein V2J09_013075 [Rumex salicifolius]
MSRTKRQFEFDLDRCLEDSADELPPEITVVKRAAFLGEDRSSVVKREQTPCSDGMEKIRMKSEQDLEETIQRITRQVKGGFCSKLPDKGEKYKATLRCCQEERERRRLQTGMQGANECTTLEDTKRSRPKRVSAEAEKEAPSCQASSLSEFASKFTAMLETGNTSCTLELDNEKIISGDFDKDMKTLGRDDRRKRKQQITRFTHDENQKNGLCLKGEERTREAYQELRSDTLNSKKTVVFLDEEEPDLGDTTATTDFGLRDTKIYYPSRDDPESIEIEFKDLNCLAPGEYLTSTIMNFYIRFLQGPSFAANNAPNDYHFFNTYFYKKLQEAILRQRTEKETSFVKFRRWWRGVNIFQKAYIFFPIHEDLHWSLAILCIPDKTYGSGPIILHLDSLGYHSSKPIFENIGRFLKEEWNIVKEESDPPVDFITSKIWKYLPRRIENKTIKVPQQNNDFDCGLFVLYFMERFIEDAPQRLRKQDLGMVNFTYNGSNCYFHLSCLLVFFFLGIFTSLTCTFTVQFGNCWFKPEEASNLREKIKMKLTEKFQKLISTYEPVNLPSNVDSEENPETPGTMDSSDSSTARHQKPDSRFL